MALWMPAGCELDACFSSILRSRRSAHRRLPRIEISQSLEGQNSLVVGKNAGNFAESAPFCESLSRKHLRIQVFADEFPTRSSREFFRQRRELFRQGRELARNRSASNREKVQSPNWIKIHQLDYTLPWHNF